MSFYTSLSGLKAAQTDLSVTSNNVANVGSIGFKKSRADFGDIITSTALQAPTTTGMGTRLQDISQEFTQGSFETTDRALDLAVSGQGFFVTQAATGASQISYTRDGAFGVDAKTNNVVNAGGAILQVLPVDDQGNVTASGLASAQNLNVPQTSGTAQATSALSMSVNLPSDADIPAARSAYATSGYSFDRFDPNSYNSSTSTTVYDAAGNATQATTYYTRTTAPTDSDPSSTWTARTFVGDKEVSADGAATVPATPLTMTFDANGTLTSPTGAVSYGAVTPTGSTTPIQFTLDYGSATKQSTAAFTSSAVTQNGYAAGALANVAVGTNGLVTATYSNGDIKNLGKVAVATFSNPAGLRQSGDATWTASGDSGAATINTAGDGGVGTIQSGSLEQANVDITEELVALITAQRNFQANAKAIDTENQMTQIAVNLRGS